MIHKTFRFYIRSTFIIHMVVRTKPIYQYPENSDGYRILITRYYPRGVSKDKFNEWIWVLSPSAGLLHDYKDGKVDWDIFARRFIEELRHNIASQEAIIELNRFSKDNEITLLCYEKSGVPCHRHIVRELIETPEALFPAFQSSSQLEECLSP